MEGADLMHVIGLFFDNGQSLLSLVNCRMPVIYAEIVRIVHEAQDTSTYCTKFMNVTSHGYYQEAGKVYYASVERGCTQQGMKHII